MSRKFLLVCLLGVACGDNEKLTNKLQQAFQKAEMLAKAKSHAQMHACHVAAALFEDPTGFARAVATKAGGDVSKINNGLRGMMNKLPRQGGGQMEGGGLGASPDLRKVYAKAGKLKEAQGDGFLAVEHVLAALGEHTKIGPLMSKAGLKPKKLAKTIAALRGQKKVNSASAEDTYEALEKYAHDLVDQAATGKIDPVIGRDDEIRYAFQHKLID